jgi:hypothetical protein
VVGFPCTDHLLHSDLGGTIFTGVALLVANSIALNSIYSSTHSTAGIGLLALPLCMWLLALALVAAEWIWRRPWSL